MESAFEQSELFNTWNQKAKAIHDAQEKLCEPIPFRISENDSSAGIVIDFADSSYYIDVIDLVNSIFNDGEIWFFQSNDDEIGFFGSCQKEGAIFEWRINKVNPSFFGIYRFTLSDYISAIKDCIQHLDQSSKSGRTIKSGYPNFDSHNLELCLAQLAQTWTFPSKFKLTTVSGCTRNILF